jgi:hypothetical protein
VGLGAGIGGSEDGHDYNEFSSGSMKKFLSKGEDFFRRLNAE